MFVCMQHGCTEAAVKHSSICVFSSCHLQCLQGLLTWGGFLLVTRPSVAVLCWGPAQNNPSSRLTSVLATAESSQCFRGSFQKQSWPSSRHFLVP